MLGDRYLVVRPNKKEKILLIIFREPQLDSLIAEDLKKALKYHCNFHLRHDQFEHIILSLRNIESIDSAGIGALISLWKHLALQTQIKVSLCRCPKIVLNLIQLCKLEHIFDILETEEISLTAANNSNSKAKN